MSVAIVAEKIIVFKNYFKNNKYIREREREMNITSMENGLVAILLDGVFIAGLVYHTFWREMCLVEDDGVAHQSLDEL